jgi:glutamate/tyrosine decarboxylase-like PLP-dependent enzyme
VHKYGYGAKGASIILYRNSELRKNQFFVSGDWPGGLFGSATMMGTRSGGPIVTAWTVIKLLGWEGYMKMAEKTMYAVKTIQNGLQTIPGLDIISNPEMSVFAITSSKNNIYEIGDEMSSRGWHFDRIMEPEAIHINVTNSNVNQVDEFLKDLEEVVMNLNRSPIRRLQSRVSESILTHLLNLFPKTVVDVISSSAASGLGSEKQKKHSRTATFYGIAAKQTDKGNVDAIILDFLDKMYNQNE